MNIRQEKINDYIKDYLGPILQQECGDQLGLITIHRVNTAPDLRNCRVTFSVFPQAVNSNDAVDLLNTKIGRIHKKLADQVRLKYTPKIQFVYDDTLEAADRIENILKKV